MLIFMYNCPFNTSQHCLSITCQKPARKHVFVFSKPSLRFLQQIDASKQVVKVKVKGELLNVQCKVINHLHQRRSTFSKCSSITTMNAKNSTTSSVPRQQNKRLCPGSDDSDTNTTSVFPRWLVVEAAEPDHSLSKLSPFALGKALQAQIGTLKTIKQLQRGDILVETEKTKLQWNVAWANPIGGSASQGQPSQITEHEQRRDTIALNSRVLETRLKTSTSNLNPIIWRHTIICSLFKNSGMPSRNHTTVRLAWMTCTTRCLSTFTECCKHSARNAKNNIWFAGNFPRSWRTSTVIPIPKPAKDASDPNAPQNLTYSLHEAGGGNDWWNRFHPACGTSIDSWHTSRLM